MTVKLIWTILALTIASLLAVSLGCDEPKKVDPYTQWYEKYMEQERERSKSMVEKGYYRPNNPDWTDDAKREKEERDNITERSDRHSEEHRQELNMRDYDTRE